MKSQSKAELIIKIIITPILYFATTELVVLVYSLIYSIRKMLQSGSTLSIQSMIQDSTNSVISNTIELTAVSALIFLPFLFFLLFYRKDEHIYKGKDILLNIPLGISACLIINVFTSIILQSASEIFDTNLLETYEELSQNLFTGNILIEILIVGLLIPVVEELIFRGVVYKNMTKLMKPGLALILSSLVFGIVHMNLTQFLYAFLLAIIMGYSYSKFKTIIAPIIIHVFSNIMSIAISEIDVITKFLEKEIVFGCSILVCLFVFILIMIILGKKEISN